MGSGRVCGGLVLTPERKRASLPNAVCTKEQGSRSVEVTLIAAIICSRITRAGEMTAALARAKSHDGPCMIEVAIDPQDCNPNMREWGTRVAAANGMPPGRKPRVDRAHNGQGPAFPSRAASAGTTGTGGSSPADAGGNS